MRSCNITILIRTLKLHCILIAILGFTSAAIADNPNAQLPDFNSGGEADGSLLPSLDGSDAGSSDLGDIPLPDEGVLPPHEDNSDDVPLIDVGQDPPQDQGTVTDNQDVFGGSDNNTQNPGASNGSQSGGKPSNNNSNNTTVSNNNSNSGNNSGSGSSGYKYTLNNNPEYNIKWLEKSVEKAFRNGAGGKGLLQAGIELTNKGNAELGLPAIALPDAKTLSEAEKLAQKNVDYLLKLVKEPSVTVNVGGTPRTLRGIDLVFNSVANKASWPRITYEPINSEDLEDDYEATCHVAFKEIVSMDQGPLYAYRASPMVPLAEALLDLPTVALETARKDFIGSKGIFACFKNNKALGLSPATFAGELASRFNVSSSSLSAMNLIPQLKAETASDDLCIDFAGNRMPWSGTSSKFFASYRHLTGLITGYDTYNWAQHLTEENPGHPAAVPIGHTISKADRFLPLVGNLMTDISSKSIYQCPTFKEMVQMMNNKGAMEFKEGNKINNVESDYNAATAWGIYSCGVGYRGRTFPIDNLTLCQKSSDADPEIGTIGGLLRWTEEEFQTPGIMVYMDDDEGGTEMIVLPYQTRVC